MTYLDSSVIVKIFTDEPDSERWRQVIGARRDLITSTLALPEVRSALRRKVQAGVLRPSVATKIWDEFRRNLEGGIVEAFPIAPDVVDQAVELLGSSIKTPLRTLDALHLATVIVKRASQLATTDQRMSAAASILGIHLV
jgi:predicted nucleic acid-binding protein